MNPKFITWFETLLHVVLATIAERMMLIIPQPQRVQVGQPIVATSARDPRVRRWPNNQVPSRLEVRLRAGEDANCSLPFGVRI